MTKPIFVIRVPYSTFMGDRKMYEETQEILSNYLEEYYVLTVVDHSVKRLEFECHNCPINKEEFKNFKDNIRDIINETLNKKLKIKKTVNSND